jgi:zona occludens toxin (predicted ATPase)
MRTNVIYFCGISEKYHLDQAFLQFYNKDTGNTAVVDHEPKKKVQVCYKTVLLDNVGVFRTYKEAQYFAESNKMPAIDYTPHVSTQEFKWVKA